MQNQIILCDMGYTLAANVKGTAMLLNMQHN